MLSYSHEYLLDLFRRDSRAAENLLRRLDVPLPEYDEVREASAHFSDLTPAEYRADRVLLLARGSRCVLGIIVEVQLTRDEEKTYAWPAYIANLRSRHRCPVCLLVVTTEQSVARWAGRSIELGPGSRCIPWVIGPSNAPVITDARQAQENIEVAVLSAIEHMQNPDTELAAHIVSVVRDAAANIDTERSKMYLDFINSQLGQAPEPLRDTMNALGFEYQSEFARRYVTEGKVELILKQLAQRFGAVPDSIQTRVRSARYGQLDTVAEQVLTAQTLEEAVASLD